ncbi:glycosyl transferase [Striga asiatica]|uniref:Glycosyl transferase n=1 Tax=Striga asiatica TaxID=4170 RepID=A0A5A7QEW5_STRAF|nr:glycosyl transferase [Striga asiatica]
MSCPVLSQHQIQASGCQTWLGRPQPKSASPLVFLSAHGRLSLATRYEAYPPLTTPHHRQCSYSPPFESLHKTTSDHPLVTVRPHQSPLLSPTGHRSSDRHQGIVHRQDLQNWDGNTRKWCLQIDEKKKKKKKKKKR